MAAPAPAPLPVADAEQSTDVLEGRLQVLRAQLMDSRDFNDASMAQVRIEVAKIRDILTARNLAALQGNTAQFEALATQIQQANRAAFLDMLHKRYCHQNPWRLVRGYREPQWCRP